MGRLCRIGMHRLIGCNLCMITSAQKLRTFLSHECLHLPAKAEDAIAPLQDTARRLREMETTIDRKRMKRYEDIAKGLKSLRKLICALKVMDIYPLLENTQKLEKDRFDKDNLKCRPPAYISIDRGLRQRRKHMHGSVFYQAVMLPDDYFVSEQHEESNEIILSPGDSGVKFSEGGRYDDLVSHS